MEPVTICKVGVPVVFYELVKQHTDRYASLDVYAATTGGRHGPTGGSGGPSPAGAGAGRASAAAADGEAGGAGGARRGSLVGGNARRGSLVGGKPADKRSADERNEEWALRVRPSRLNKAKNLYADFEYKWRFWKLVVLMQKLLLVFVVMFAVDWPLAAASLMGLVHLAMLVTTVYARPYMDARPDQLSIAISFANVFNAAV